MKKQKQTLLQKLGLRSNHGHCYFPEQKKIIDVVEEHIENRDVVLIAARPGTGKTTTLVGIAKKYKNKNFLYLSFSKDSVIHAKKILPSNCETFHTHSFAYHHTGNKDIGIIDEYKTLDISKILSIPMKKAAMVNHLIKEYLTSTVDSFDEYHQKKIEKRYTRDIIELSKLFLKKMKQREIAISHDYYLKEFTISIKNREDFLENIDCILIDEYQDTSPIMAQMYKNLSGAKIYVGDSDQAIYGFMGAQDASEGIKFDAKYELNYNFRSRKNIIDKANTILDVMNKKYKIIQAFDDDSVSKINKNGIICRTNALIIEYVSIYFDFYIPKGVDAIFSLPLSVASWLEGRREDHFHWALKKCKTESELKKYISDSGDWGMSSAYKVARKYGYKKLSLLYEKAKNTSNKNAKTVILTAHASKGLEFDKIRIAPDFPSLLGVAKDVRMGRESKDKLLEECRLYYVAITRGKEKIIDTSANGELKKPERIFIKNTLLPN